MKNIRRHRKMIAVVGSLVGGAVFATFLVTYLSTAKAQGFPQPLYYSGLLTDSSGKALTSASSIVIDLWDAQSGGNKKCTTTAFSPSLKQGRFRVALVKSCLAAIQNTPDLWVEVAVDGTSMGRTKIGAVPYAATMPETLKVSGDASFTVHSNTDTPTTGKSMFSLMTGATTPKEVFSVDNQGKVDIVGKVGIGTTKPSSELDVNGEIRATTLYVAGNRLLAGAFSPSTTTAGGTRELTLTIPYQASYEVEFTVYAMKASYPNTYSGATYLLAGYYTPSSQVLHANTVKLIRTWGDYASVICYWPC